VVNKPEGESPSSYVSWRQDGPVWTIVMNRPEARNAMSSDMYEAVKRGVRIGAAQHDVAVIVLRGIPGAFAVGGDLESFLGLVERGPEYVRANLETVYHDTLPFHAILHSGTPVVAAIDGVCVAGGLLIAMCCDITIATERSRFAIPEGRVGLADEATARLVAPSIGLMRTRYLALTGKMIDAVQAERWGLITMCVPDEELEGAVATVTADLQQVSPTSHCAYKRVLNSCIGTISSDVLIDVAVTPDSAEGLRAFRDKRSPSWPSLRRPPPGHRLAANSPTS
jgi:enoyl-CoA hydratase/carnithine racemase